MNPSRPDDLARQALPLAAVTGATGFIGRHLVVALHRAGFRVRLLLRREPDVAEWRGLPAPEVVVGCSGSGSPFVSLVVGTRSGSTAGSTTLRTVPSSRPGAGGSVFLRMEKGPYQSVRLTVAPPSEASVSVAERKVRVGFLNALRS